MTLLTVFAMDFLKEYGSNDSEAVDSDDSRSTEGELSENTASISDLHGTAVRQVYLIMYSQAYFEKFPTRESFGKAVVRSFEGTDTKVLQWVCCKEPHQSNGYHYHMAIKLNCCKRWLSSKKYLHRISVHFSDAHYNYYSAWKYTTKTDKYVLESDNHPDLWDSKAPKTESASISRKKNVVEREEDENTNCFESASCHDSNTRSKNSN